MANDVMEIKYPDVLPERLDPDNGNSFKRLIESHRKHFRQYPKFVVCSYEDEFEVMESRRNAGKVHSIGIWVYAGMHKGCWYSVSPKGMFVPIAKYA